MYINSAIIDDVQVHIKPRGEPRIESYSKADQQPGTCRGFPLL